MNDTPGKADYIVTSVVRFQVEATDRTGAMSQVVKALDGAQLDGAEITRFFNVEARRDD